MAAVRVLSIGNFTGVFPRSFLSVTIEDLQDAAGVGGLDVVLIGGPDELPIFFPGDRHSLFTSERNSKSQRFTHSERGVLQPPDKAQWLCEKH